MARFVDVLPGSTFYDDIMEANNTILEDGVALLNGMTYQKFQDGKPYVYEEIKATGGQIQYTVPKKIVPSADNPIYVMVDGVNWGYREAKVVGDSTEITLFTAPREGAIISVMSYGVPLTDNKGRPTGGGPAYYPNFGLQYKDRYVYWPYYGNFEEVTVFGQRLKRVEIDPADYAHGLAGGYGNEFGQEMARKYIGNKTDVYIIVKGYVHLPWNLNGVTCHIWYSYNTSDDPNNIGPGTVRRVHGDFKPGLLPGLDPYRNDRYFPDAYINRNEIAISLNRLRKHYLARLTDKGITGSKIDEVQQAYSGQKVFRLNGTYPANEGKIEVYEGDDRYWWYETYGEAYLKYRDSSVPSNFDPRLSEADIQLLAAKYLRHKLAPTISSAYARHKIEYEAGQLSANAWLVGQNLETNSSFRYFDEYYLMLSNEEKIILGKYLRNVVAPTLEDSTATSRTVAFAQNMSNSARTLRKLSFGVDYVEFDDQTILLKKPAIEGTKYSFYYERTAQDSRFTDLPDSATLVQSVLNLEGDRLESGEHVLQGPDGMFDTKFRHDTDPSRYYALATMYRFMKWIKERLIY